MMKEKISLNEIIVKNLKGIWCDGIVLLEVYDDKLLISNIYNNNGKQLHIDKYPIERTKRVFTKVEELSYDEAIKRFVENNNDIRSPELRDEVMTFDGINGIDFGGNVYCHSNDGKVIVNDQHRFESIHEIISMGFITEKEKDGKWLVF